MSNSLLPDIVKSLAPLYLGYALNIGLFGVVSTQVYYYYLAFPNDRLRSKCTVYVVYLLETIQTIIFMVDGFERFGKGFGDFDAFENVKLVGLSVPILSGITGCIVQIFYSYRINVLSRTNMVGHPTILISVTACIAAIITGVESFRIGELTGLTGTTLFIASGFWWGGCAICDVVIAIAMTYLLSKHDTDFRSTRLILTKLTRLTIETGTMTALVAVINLALYYAYPDTSYFSVTVLINAKLYCSSLLVLLNCRIRIVDGREEASSGLPSTSIDIPMTFPAINLVAPPAPFQLQRSLCTTRSPDPVTKTQADPLASGVHITTDFYVMRDRADDASIV